MKKNLQRLAIVLIGLLTFTFHAQNATADRPVSFNRDIRPILTDRCFACHGPDAETVAAGLRLDLRDEAIREAIVPGDTDASELLRRITSADEDEVMPPPELHKPLDHSQIALLKQWISEGAPYEQHWAYTPLQKPHIDPAIAPAWCRNDIDRLIAARLHDEGIEPSPRADHTTLLRRLAWDLTGLPPSAEQANAFLNNPSDQAYAQLVDELLASPSYGERMAIYWLDLVRYADTVGYHGDQDVSMSPYRDYVINAFHRNLPYDQFVREQIAGDLLPDPTPDQLIASGYNRLNQTTEEGGAQPKEYLAIYFADRVRNVSQVFMGATIGCAQCHDHKYDPYTAKDFYSLGAFFADLQEQGKYGARSRPPEMPVLTADQTARIAELDRQIAAAKQELTAIEKRLLSEQPAWESSVLAATTESQEIEHVWLGDGKPEAELSGDWNLVSAADGHVYQGDDARKQVADGLTQHFFIKSKKTLVIEAGMRLFSWVYLDPQNPPTAIMLQFNDGEWNHRAVWGNLDIPYGRTDKPGGANDYRHRGELPATGQWVRLEINAADVGLAPSTVIHGMAFTQFSGTVYWDTAGAIASSALTPELIAAIKEPESSRSKDQSKLVRDHYFSVAQLRLDQMAVIEALKSSQTKVRESAPTTLISKSVSPREIRVLNRGNWMDESGEIVQPAIPAFLGTLETEGRASRLDLANWLCRDDNVLTARTMVNRLWYLMFGRGICSSVDDLGGQGTYPSQPELLDYLANEFVQSGWNIKHVLRLIVSSATYQQSSKPTPDLRARDPYNELFARQGRFRIGAEMVRDAALWHSGLLVERAGGVSVKPYQPAGYYDQLNFPRRSYVPDANENQYRRGVYTHWQRTFLHPMLKAFDAPSREECTAIRSRSNTPLQALVLLNDPTFVEAARVFAARIMREGGTSSVDRIQWAYQAAVIRPCSPFVSEQLERIFTSHHQSFIADPGAAAALISHGNSPVATDLDAAELAAWTSVARVILNLNETITRY
jgi:mono/diheme cytochrome c family protein